MKGDSAQTLVEQFKTLEDPRTGNAIRHELLDIVVIAICAVICHADDWPDVEEFGKSRERWFKTFLRLPNGIPSHDTFRRVFALLDPEAFERCLAQWARKVAGVLHGKVVSIDGKRLRRSHDHYHGHAAIETVSAWLGDAGLVLGQVKVAEASNEIRAVTDLLEVLDLRGCIVTADALNCQTQNARVIVDKGGEYVFALKDNHPKLLEQVTATFEHEGKSNFKHVAHSVHVTREKSHGRIETRRYIAITDPDYIDYLNREGCWWHLGSVIRVERQRAVNVQPGVSVSYYISSLTDQAGVIAAAVRSHWHIENGLHWCLDMAFDEDQSRLRVGHGAHNFATLRRFTLSLLKRETSYKRGIEAKRLKAAWNPNCLLKVLDCV